MAFIEEPPVSSLMELLAIRLSPQAGKSLAIRRRPESSGLIQHAFGIVSALRRICILDWIPACAGMTVSRYVKLRPLI
jgi:hypothetical protein